MDRRTITLLTGGHCFIDFCQAVVPALLPFLVERHGLSNSAAGGLVMALAVASSVIQPLFGQLADRVSVNWLLPASLLATGAGLVAAGVAPHYETMLAALVVCGIGVAAFHPEAARLVNFAAGDRPATGMSVFSLGGNVGFALAPLVPGALVMPYGPRGLLLLLLPAAVVALLFLLHARRFRSLVEDRHPAHAEQRRAGKDQWTPFVILGLTIGLRSVVFAGLYTFLALYWIEWFGLDAKAGNRAQAIFLGSGVLGTISGGWLADRFGRNAMLRLSLILVTGLLMVYATTDDPQVALLVLIPLAAALFSTTSTLVVLGQEYLPGRVGVASGVTIGLAVSCGGVAAPFLGRLVDVHGFGALPPLLAVLALTAAALTFTLPRPQAV